MNVRIFSWQNFRALIIVAEPPLDGLKPGSPGAARLRSPKSSPYPSRAEEMSHEAHLRKTGGRQSRRNEADTQTRSSLMPPHFEHEHDDEHEDDLVADFGVSFSVERSAALRLCAESPVGSTRTGPKILPANLPCPFHQIFVTR
jgi:hypothetical protein